MKIILTIIPLIIHSLIFSTSENEKWTLGREEDGIKIFVRPTEVSEINEFKAKATLNYNIETISAVIKDVENYNKWYDKVVEGKVLKETHNDTFIYYIMVDIPFPFKNRDLISEFSAKEDSEEKYFRFVAKNDELDQLNDVVRITVSDGSWYLKKIDENTTYVEHQYVGDPQLDLPSSISNAMILDGPINTINNLRSYCDKL